MFENPRRDRQARNFTTNVPKVIVLKSSSEQIFSRELPLGAPELSMTDIKISIITRFGRDTRQHKPVWWRLQVLKISYLDVMHQLMKPIEK